MQANEKNGDWGYGWLKTNYAGSGPLKIREWRANEIVTLERNDNYWGPKSKPARVILRHLKESATQRLTLEKGDVDIARNLSPQDLAAVGATKGSFVQVNLTANTDLHSVDEFKRLVLRQQNDTTVRLEDVADVVLGSEDYDTQVRTPKDSFHWYADHIAGSRR